MLDTYALRVFLEAARTGSFTEAAQVLDVTQPAISHQIKSLEDYLQVPLFERAGRHIQLTKAGQALVPLARQAVQMVMDIENTMRAAEGRVVGNLTIGCSEPSAHYLLPHLLARFKRIYPDIAISVPIVHQETLIEKVLQGEYDVGITGVMHLAEHDLRGFALYEDHYVLVTPIDHAWAHKRLIAPEELFNERFVCRDIHSVCRRVVASELKKHGYEIENLDVVMEIDSPEAQAIAVEHGIGLSFMAMMSVAPRLAMGKLATVQVGDIVFTSPVYLVYRAAGPPSPVLEQLIKFLNLSPSQDLIEMLSHGHMI